MEHPEFEEVFETLPGHGWLTFREAQLLWRIAETTTGPILEVGCYYGRSTVLLAALGRPMYCVDPFDHFDTADPSGEIIKAAFLDNLATRNIINVQLFCEKIEDWQIRSAGFAYLDGDHTCDGTTNQINAALATGAKTLCIHDYSNTGGGRSVVKAIDASALDVQKVTGSMAHCSV